MNTTTTMMTETQRINGVRLQADTVYGVSIIDVVDMPADAESMRPRDFYESLRLLEAGETIYAAFSGDNEELFNRIADEYGIK